MLPAFPVDTANAGDSALALISGPLAGETSGKTGLSSRETGTIFRCHEQIQTGLKNLSQASRTIGVSLLSLVTLLIGILGLMLSLSLLLRAYIFETFEGLPLLAAGLLILGCAYLVLAYGLWRLKSWVRQYCLGLLVLVLMTGVVDIARSDVLAVGRTMVFALAVVVNIVVFMALQLPAVKSLFQKPQ